MAKFTLSTYSIRIVDKQADNEYVRVHNFHLGTSLCSVLKDFFDSINQQANSINSVINHANKSVFTVEDSCKQFSSDDNACTLTFCIVKS